MRLQKCFVHPDLFAHFFSFFDFFDVFEFFCGKNMLDDCVSVTYVLQLLRPETNVGLRTT